MTTFEDYEPRAFKIFSSPCAFALVDADGSVLYAGMSKGSGAEFNAYTLPERIGSKPGVRLRVYRCATDYDAKNERALMLMAHSPRYNKERKGRPRDRNSAGRGRRMIAVREGPDKIENDECRWGIPDKLTYQPAPPINASTIRGCRECENRNDKPSPCSKCDNFLSRMD